MAFLAGQVVRRVVAVREGAMRGKLHWPLLCVLALPSLGLADDPDAKNAARVKWARGVLTDCLDAALAGNGAAASALASPDLHQAYARTGYGPLGFSRLLGQLNLSFDSYKVTAEEADPDGGEILFKGELVGKGKKADFTARVAKEWAGGKWSIRYLFVKEREEPGQSKPK
jgi:hypothetical protein